MQQPKDTSGLDPKAVRMAQVEREGRPGGGLRQGAKSFWGSLMGLGDFIDSAWAKLNNLTETNFDLACQMAQDGRVNDAIMRFRITLWISPDHEPSLYNLGCLYHHKGMNHQALQLFKRILAKDPAHANALYMVATIDPSLLKKEMQPQFVPPVLLLEYFDNLAFYYDQVKAQELYRLPSLLHQLLRPLLDSETGRHDMLDIGCGTGLCGAQFRGQFNNIIGVDLSDKMLDLAHKRMDNRAVKIYNRLIQQDARHYLSQPDLQLVDVVIAMSVLPYIGDLQLLFQGVFKGLRSGGMFAVSFDPYTERDGFGVMPQTGYFGHSLNYVLDMAKLAGFETNRTGEVEASANKNVQLCFFKKPGE